MLDIKFALKHLGVADVVLGIRIHQTPQGLALSQSHYIKEVLDKFKYMEFNIAKNPLDVSFALRKNEGERDSQLENFQLHLRKMVQNEIDDALDQLGMIKSGGDQSSVEDGPTGCEKLDIGRIPDECRTNINAERLVSQLQEFVEEFLLVFLGDVPNHKGKRLNEVLAKIGVVVGDIICVIKEDANKIDDAMIQILEKIKDLKADVEERYKSLKYSPPDEFPTVGGLSFLDSFLRKLNNMLKSESSLDFMMKPYNETLDEDLSYLTSVFRDVAKVHHKDEEILKDLQRCTVKLAYEAEVSIDSILVQYNALSHSFARFLQSSKRASKFLRRFYVPVLSELTEPSKHLPTHHSNPVNDEEIVGFENESEKIIQYLIRGTHEIDVVPIVGMGGQGKTTVARKVYNNGSIVHHFDVRAWCIISQSYKRRGLLQEIFSQVTGKEDKGHKEDIIADELKKSLTGKRYLIVLDDMWDVKAWDDLRLSFPDVGNRSRIVITTQLDEVAKQVKHHIDPYSLPFLTPDESLKLLQKKVFQQESFPPSLQDVSKAVAERCKGLPLLSYDNLPDHLRPCLLYMGMFPEDSRIPVSELISLWIAECFVQNIEESGRLEETAEGYLNDLISSNVVMVSGRRYNRKVKYCQVHDVVLHFFLNKSREEKFMLAVKGNPNRFQSSRWKDRRLSDMRLVKVLYLNCPRDADIFSDIFRPLIHLKYLAVDSIFNNDWVLNLPHLETLIMRKRVLGESMKFWKMEKLRHVDIPEFIVDWYKDKQGMFDESSKLENLRIFKGAVIEEADNLDVLLRKYPNLQKLGISFRKAPTSSEADYGKPFCINMESHTHLQSLSLFFPGSPVLGLQLPSNLKKLVLSRVPVDTANAISTELAVYFLLGLPVLEYLQLTECNIWSKEWCIPTYIKFLKLKLLKLVRLGATTWDASEESFPQLETLVVELIGPCTDSLEASAVRIKEGVLENEGNDRIEIITKFMWVARKDRAELLTGIVYATSAFDIWEDLKEWFDKVNRMRLYQLHREISTLSQGTDSVAAYFTKLKNLWNERQILLKGITPTLNEAYAMIMEDEMQHLTNLVASTEKSDPISMQDLYNGRVRGIGGENGERPKPAVMMGYSTSHKGYLLLDLDSNRLFVSRDVSFQEHVFPFANRQDKDDATGFLIEDHVTVLLQTQMDHHKVV
ncbi:hypothetical protein CQW23_22780 [Capsicum baccatum]|uniref:NB-ARC domain-containing protein n=1 Tax=Capsicum baccatum TaxID=33114 RepID=A0A2G2W1U3_CAPBA|nr:hypothetical protein CQW23_22780 [Capsicum baccatum]